MHALIKANTALLRQLMESVCPRSLDKFEARELECILFTALSDIAWRAEGRDAAALYAAAEEADCPVLAAKLRALSALRAGSDADGALAAYIRPILSRESLRLGQRAAA